MVQLAAPVPVRNQETVKLTMHASSMIARASIPYFDLIEQLCHHKLLGPEVFVHEVGFSNLPFCIGALESSSGTKILH